MYVSLYMYMFNATLNAFAKSSRMTLMPPLSNIIYSLKSFGGSWYVVVYCTDESLCTYTEN